MPISVRVDTNHREAVAAFDAVLASTTPRTRRVVQRGALNIRRAWRQAWSGLAHAPSLPRAVTYDIGERGGWIIGEIGPDKARPQGALGNLLEFGSVNNAPRPGGLPALEAEAPRYERALDRLAAELLEERFGG